MPGRKETPQDRYHKAHTTSLTVRLMNNTEQDIIQKLNSVNNKAGYIKQLIRADIAKADQQKKVGIPPTPEDREKIESADAEHLLLPWEENEQTETQQTWTTKPNNTWKFF